MNSEKIFSPHRESKNAFTMFAPVTGSLLLASVTPFSLHSHREAVFPGSSRIRRRPLHRRKLLAGGCPFPLLADCYGRPFVAVAWESTQCKTEALRSRPRPKVWPRPEKITDVTKKWVIWTFVAPAGPIAEHFQITKQKQRPSHQKYLRRGRAQCRFSCQGILDNCL